MNIDFDDFVGSLIYGFLISVVIVSLVIVFTGIDPSMLFLPLFNELSILFTIFYVVLYVLS